MTLSKKDADRIMEKVDAMRNRAWNLGLRYGAKDAMPIGYTDSQASLDDRQDEIQRALYALIDEENVDRINDATEEWAIEALRIDGTLSERFTLKSSTYSSIEDWLKANPLCDHERIARRRRLSPTEDWEGWEPV